MRLQVANTQKMSPLHLVSPCTGLGTANLNDRYLSLSIFEPFRLKCHLVEFVGQEPDHVQIDFTA